MEYSIKYMDLIFIRKHGHFIIMRSHVGWRGERNILYKSVETSL